MRKRTLPFLPILIFLICQNGFAEGSPQKLADTKPGYWNRPESLAHLYRVMRIRYVGPKKPGASKSLVPVVHLTPTTGSLFDLRTAEDCRGVVIDEVSAFIDANPEVIRRGKRLWLDYKEGVVGSETDKEYYFTRFVCLPMSTVDDLDLIGTQYRAAYVKNKSFIQFRQKEVADGYATTLEPSDPRSTFRYDPVRFFKRFEKFGITQNLAVPDKTPIGNFGEDTTWNTIFKVMPLGEATTLGTSGEKPNQVDLETARKIYNNLKYKPLIKLDVDQL